MFMKLCKHFNQALHYVLHVLHASSCSPPMESEHQAKAYLLTAYSLQMLLKNLLARVFRAKI